LIVVAGEDKAEGTPVFDGASRFAELQNKVITVICRPQPNVNVTFSAKTPLDPTLLEGLCVNVRDGVDQALKNKACDGGPEDQDGSANGEIHFYVDPNNGFWLQKGQIFVEAQTVKAAGLFELDPTQVPGDGDAKQDCDLMVVQKCDVVFSYVSQKLTKPGDTDGDGCPDARENRPKAQANEGGGRDFLDPNDYYDVYGPGQSLTLDGVIDLPNDILGVIQHFAPQGLPPYDVRFDRGPTRDGENHWKREGPDGVIDLPNDILGIILQFQHNCR
ncbi:MAG: hypothetical protein IIB88_00070, partial [Chloroflexi bacterium]|nr:hypothetical protein [Chloroflexota bacterium]